MAGEEVLGPLLEALYGAQVSPPEIYTLVEGMSPDDRRNFIDTRAQRLLTGVSRMAPYELGAIAGMGITDSEGRGQGLIGINIFNIVKALTAIVGTRKSDISPLEIKPQVGSLDPKDQQALSQIGLAVEWLRKPGEEPIRTRISLQDFLFEFADIRNIDYTEEQMGIGEGLRYLRPASQRLGMSRGWLNVFSRTLQRRIGVLPPDDPRRQPSNERQILPLEWTSMTQPLEDIRGVKVIGVHRMDTNDQTIQRLADALDPYVTAAEALLAFWGYMGPIRQNVETFMLFPGLRDLMGGAPYNELYATAVHLCLPNFSTEAYPSHFLKVLWRGIKPRIQELMPKLTGQQLELFRRCYEVSYPKDPMALSAIASLGGNTAIERYFSDIPDYMRIKEHVVEKQPDGTFRSTGKIKEISIGRPIGTQEEVAKNIINHSAIDPFDGIDFTQVPHGFIPDGNHPGQMKDCDCSVCSVRRTNPGEIINVNVLEQAGITGEALGQIIARGEHIGGKGFITLVTHGTAGLWEYPFAARYWRNWPHYLGSFEPTLLAMGKNAPEAAFEISIPEGTFGGLTGDRQRYLSDKRNVFNAKVVIEHDVAFRTTILEGVFPAIKGDEKAWRFGNPADLALYLERGLINIISGHFVYPIDRVVDSEALGRMRQEFPSAGLIMNVDWKDFVTRRGIEIRPQRLMDEVVERMNIKNALENGGAYEMTLGSKEGGIGNIAERGWITPFGEIIYQMVDNVEFFDRWKKAVGSLKNIDRDVRESKYGGRLDIEGILKEEWFSPVFLYGDIAIPGSLWRKLLEMLEAPVKAGGLAFLQGGHLNSVRRFIDLAEQTGLLRPSFTFVHPRLLTIQQQVEAEREIINRFSNATGFHFLGLGETSAGGMPPHVNAKSSTAPW